jgi:hypothetical protein
MGYADQIILATQNFGPKHDALADRLPSQDCPQLVAGTASEEAGQVRHQVLHVDERGPEVTQQVAQIALISP